MLSFILTSLAWLGAAAQLHVGPGVFPIDNALVFLPETTAPAQATAANPPADCVLPDIITWKMLASDAAFVPAPGPELLAAAPPYRWQADPNAPTRRSGKSKSETLALPGGAQRTLVGQRTDDPNAPPLPTQVWIRCLQRRWPPGRSLQVQVPAIALYPKPGANQDPNLPRVSLSRVQEWARRPGWSYIQGNESPGGPLLQGWARTLLLDEVVGDSATLQQKGLQALHRGDTSAAVALLRRAAALSPGAYSLLGDLQSAYELDDQPEHVPELADQRTALYHDLAEAEAEAFTVGSGTLQVLDALARETRALNPDEAHLCELTRHTLDAAEFMQEPFGEDCFRIQWQELAAQAPTLLLRCLDAPASGVQWDSLVMLARPVPAVGRALRAAGDFLRAGLPAYMESRGDLAGCQQPNNAVVPLKNLATLWPKIPPCLQAILQPRLQTELARMAGETCYCDDAAAARRAVGRLGPVLRGFPEDWEGEAVAGALEQAVTRRNTRFRCTP